MVRSCSSLVWEGAGTEGCSPCCYCCWRDIGDGNGNGDGDVDVSS